MSILNKLRSMGRLSPQTSTRRLQTIIVAGEKGGVGKSTCAEFLSILLEDREVTHTVAECEGERRLERRLGGHVVHHQLHQEDAKRLAADPDALNVYWDHVHAHMAQTVTIVDLAANALQLQLRWASSRATNAALDGGLGIELVLVATADAASLSGTLTSARQVRNVLPNARIWVVLNDKDGLIRLEHPGVAHLLKEIGCGTPIRLPACRAPDAVILKSQGRFDRTALMPETELMRHGLDLLRAGRALEGFQDWILECCGELRPVVDAVLAPRQ
jgi:hypothetical protein